MDLKNELLAAARGGIKAQRAIIDQYNRDNYDGTPAGSPRPAVARGTRDLTGEARKRADRAMCDAQARIDEIAARAKAEERKGMADPMPEAAQRIFEGWAHREPGEDEITAVVESYGDSVQVTRAANAQYERIGSTKRVRHRLDARADAIDRAAGWAKATVHHAVAGGMLDGLEAELDKALDDCLGSGAVSGNFDFGEPGGHGIFNQLQRASRRDQ